MQKFTLRFDPQNKMFMGNFSSIPKEFIQTLKEKGFLENVTPSFIEQLPDAFDGELNTDPIANSEDTYWIFFYLNIIATKEMRISTQEYLNRSIDINEDDGSLEFNILIAKDSEFVKKADDQEIIFEF